MSLTNTPSKFGSITKYFHWLTLIGFIGQFYLVYRREYFPKGSQIKLDYILWHKAIGITMLALGILFILWHHLNKRPNFSKKNA